MATAFKKISKKVEAIESEESNNSDSEESVQKLQSDAGSDNEEVKEEAAVAKVEVDSVSKLKPNLIFV